MAAVDFRAHCEIEIRAVSENRDAFQSRGKDIELAGNSERRKRIKVTEMDQNLQVILLSVQVVIAQLYSGQAEIAQHTFQ